MYFELNQEMDDDDQAFKDKQKDAQKKLDEAKAKAAKGKN